MPNVSVSIPHQLGRAEAKRRIQEQAVTIFQQQGSPVANFRETWSGDTMQFTAGVMGQSINGDIVVGEQDVRFNIALPWLLAMVAGTVKQKIEQQGRHLLTGPATK
jgi:putative polyhydroxyalkanoate system protein